MQRERDSGDEVIESPEKVAAIDSLSQTHQQLAIFLMPLGINNTEAKGLWNILLGTLKSRLQVEAFGREKALGRETIGHRNGFKMF